MFARVVGAVEASVDAAVAWARQKSARADHALRAGGRYQEVYAARLAAAIAYYGFFAVLALGLLAFSILGYVLAGNESAVRAANQYLATNFPFLKTSDIQNARQAVAIVSSISLVFAGVGWVDGMRSAQRAVWHLNQQPGNVVIRWLLDLTMLVGLGVLLTFSLWVTDGIQALASDLVAWVSPASAGGLAEDSARTVLAIFGQLLSVAVNLVMAAAVLVAVPRLRVPVRRMLPPVLLVGLGFTFLSTVGRIIIKHTERNPAYQVAGWAVGLLVFLYLFSQLLLFGAALAATSDRGHVVDLAAGPPDPLP